MRRKLLVRWYCAPVPASLLCVCRFTAEEKAKRDPFCFMPFGMGPRNCIGMRFALLEAKMALIQILRQFRLVRSPDTEVSCSVCEHRLANVGLLCCHLMHQVPLLFSALRFLCRRWWV